MARKKEALRYQIHNNLKQKTAYGESKHADKQNRSFGESTYKIYSFGTYDTYLKECEQYGNWLVSVKHIDKFTKLADTEKYAKEYIKSRLKDGVSVYTAKMERAALGMLYGKRIEIDMPKRDNKNIKRSRLDCKRDRHISPTGKHKDIFTICKGTGCRRKDLNKLTVDSFKRIGGHLYVEIKQSKGGRDRLTPVAPCAVEAITHILEKAKAEGREKLFDKIPAKIDVHSLRREYATTIYKAFSDDRTFRDTYLKASGIPGRHEYRSYKDKGGIAHTREVKTNMYKDRNGNVYDRDDLYAVSQALGHNRLDVSVTHYLKR